MNNIKNKIIPAITALGAIALAGSASAATIFTNAGGTGDGSIVDATNWDNGLPAAGNDGTIAIDSNGNSIYSVFGTATVRFTAGAYTGAAKTNIQASTLSVEGGDLSASSYFIINSTATANVSSGSVTVPYTGTNTGYGHFGGGGQVNISGSGVIETWRVDQGHSTDIASGWTGSWTVTDNFSTAADWASIIIIDGSSPDSYNWTYDGAGITNQAEFDAAFEVSLDGKTLTLASVPEPSSTALLGLAGLGLILRRRK